MSTRIISEATIAKCLNKEHIFIKEMKKCAKMKPSKWDDCFDGDLDPETMQPAVEFSKNMPIFAQKITYV